MSALFEAITLRGVTIPNRVWLGPMCQYSCFDRQGKPHDWHLVHLGARASGGFGLVMTEATAVLPNGRITPHCAGIWNDDQAAEWKRVAEFVSSQGAVPAIQLAHSGRKGSVRSPLQGPEVSLDQNDSGWRTWAPSPIAFGALAQPKGMTVEDIAVVTKAFGEAAIRADRAGFGVVEIHAAHGYLLHEFLSPISNQRTDAYGGNFEGRCRFLLEVVDQVTNVWPDHKPLFVRLSATDWIPNGWNVDDSAQLAHRLKEHGVDLIDVSSGGLDPKAEIPIHPGYQVPFSKQIKASAKLPVTAVGLITEPRQANNILESASADVIMIARAALRMPSWPLWAAHVLGRTRSEIRYPPPYTRGAWLPEDSSDFILTEPLGRHGHE